MAKRHKVMVPKFTHVKLRRFNKEPLHNTYHKMRTEWELSGSANLIRDIGICDKCDKFTWCNLDSLASTKVPKNCPFIAEQTVNQEEARRQLAARVAAIAEARQRIEEDAL